MALPENFDLLTPATFDHGHPHEAYDQIRDQGRIVRHPGNDDVDPFWLLTSHADVRALSIDTDRFTSSEGFNISTAGKNMRDSEIAETLGRNILGYDVPEHTEFRAALMPAFTAKKLEHIEQVATDYVDQLLDEVPLGEEIDFVQSIAQPLPIRVLGQVLGIPPEDEAQLLHWTNYMVGVLDPEIVADPRDAFKAYMDVFAYGKNLVEQRRREPTDDLMSLVAHARLDGAVLDDATRNGMCATLIAAGNETTRNALSGAAVLLARNPQQRDWLAANPDQTPNAVAELLRRVTPVIHMLRTAKEDLEIAGQTVRRGEKIAMLYGAVNHDPKVFPEPYELKLDRENARSHLAFGSGPHFCLGSRLAQLELRIALNGLVKRFSKFELTGNPRFMRNNFVSGIKTLPMVLA